MGIWSPFCVRAGGCAEAECRRPAAAVLGWQRERIHRAGLVARWTLPPYDEAVSRLRDHLHRDEEWAEPPPTVYADLEADAKAERIARGQQLFKRDHLPHPAFINRMRELGEWMASRSEQTFYVYVPPYYLDELTRHTDMTAADFERVVSQIVAIFTACPTFVFAILTRMAPYGEASILSIGGTAGQRGKAVC